MLFESNRDSYFISGFIPVGFPYGITLEEYYDNIEEYEGSNSNTGDDIIEDLPF